MKTRLPFLLITILLVVTVQSARAQQGVADLHVVLEKLAAMDAAQADVLQQLKSIDGQLADMRKTNAAPPPGRTPPAPVLPGTPVSIQDAPRKGDQNARVVIIEYADFQCPFCGEFARRTLPEIEKRYLATGNVQLVFKHFPLQQIHPQAVMAAETAECAGQQGKFWSVHDLLFAEQQRLDPSSLVATARNAQVDIEQFSACVKGPGAEKVRQDLAAARAMGLGVTPTFLIGMKQPDGLVRVERILTGARDASAFAALIEPMLNDSAVP